jgi:hypothetical protein
MKFVYQRCALIPLAFLTYCLTARPAFVADIGRWGDVSPTVRAWFKSVRSPQGVPCCDVADGHRTDYELRPTGYWVPVPELPPSRYNWMQVPPEAVVHNAGNPVGEAVVWYARQTTSEGRATFHIRCFVPGGGV